MTRLAVNILIDGNNAVKGRNFSDYWYVGDPINSTKIFSDMGVDEILITDIAASQNGKINFNLLEKMVSQSSVPIGYIGGISNLLEVDKLVAIGFDRVGLNKNRHDMQFVNAICQKYGRQSIFAMVDVIENDVEPYLIEREREAKSLRKPILEEILTLEKIGFGEIVLNNVSRDGTLRGLEVPLYAQLASKLNIGLCIAGGYRDIDDYADADIIDNITGIYVGRKFISLGGRSQVLLNYENIVR